MKNNNEISKIIICDFKGLEGEREYELNKIVALCEPVGSGKTSIIEAIRWALTNELPDGKVVNDKSDKAKVTIVFENGESFGRETSKKKSVANKYYHNDKKVSLKDFNIALEEVTGVDPNLAKVISSADVIKNLNNQEFANIILSYLPEKLTLDYMIKKAEDNNINFNEESLDLIKEYFGFGEFELDSLNNYYEKLKIDRRDAKKAIKKLETLYESRKDVLNKKPDGDKKSCEEILKNLNEQRDEAIRYEQNLKNYEKTVENQKKHFEQIKILENKIKETPNGIDHSEKVFNELNKRMNEYRNLESTLYNNMQQCKNNIAMFKKALDNINNSSCPLSNKIKCTSDKTNAIEDIKNTLSENMALYKKNKADYAELSKNVKKLKEIVKITQDEKQAFLNKQNMQKYLDQLKSFVAKKPNEVKKENVSSVEEIDKCIKQFKDMLKVFDNIEEVKQTEKRIEKGKQYLSNLEILTYEFSPKGNLRQIIVNSYLETFSELCNKKAKELFDGLEIKFDANEGVELLADIKGNGNFLNLKSLSGGEKASVIFLIMDMLNSLSGFNIFILDELGVLDEKVFARLVDIIKKYEDEYSLCVMASINHEDTVKILKEKDIEITKIDNYKNIE